MPELSPKLSPAARAFADRAARGEVALQQCGRCGAVAWPPRALCGACWSDALAWTAIAPTGTLLADALLHTSLDPAFNDNPPWRIGAVRLDAGPVVIAHCDRPARQGGRVRLRAGRDAAGVGVFIAVGENAAAVEDEKLRLLINEG